MSIQIATLIYSVEARTAKAESDLRRIDQVAQSVSFSGVSKNAVAMGTVIGNVVADVAQRMASMATSVVQAGFAFNGLKEQATVAFTKMLGSASAAKSFLDELFTFAAKTPFEFPDVLRAAQKFKAMGFEAKAVIPALTSIGDAVAGMGGSSVQVERVTNAILQMKAKGKVTSEEMTQQLGEVIPAWKLLAQELGISIPEAQKRVEKGAIDVDVAIRALLAGMSKEFGGMMEQQSQSWQGMLSTMSDISSQMAGQLMEPLFAASKDVLSKILAGLPEFQRQFNQAWKDIVSEVGNSLGQLKPTVENAINDVKSLWASQHNEIINITKFAWNAVFAGFIKPAVDGISRLISASSKAFAGDWEGAMARLVGSTEAAGSKILGTVGRWVQALARVSGLITGLSGVVGAASQGGGAGAAVDGFWKDATQKLRDGSKAAEDAAYAAGNRISKALGGGIKGGGKGGGGKSDAEKALDEAFKAVTDWLKKTDQQFELSKEVFAKLPTAIRKTFDEAANAFHKSVADAQMWGAKIQAAFIEAANGKLGQSLIVKLKGTKITFESPVIDVQSNVKDLAIAIPRIKITPEMLKQAEDFKEAQQRTLDDWVRIQVKAQDAAKENQIKHDAAMRTIAANEATKRNEAFKKAYDDLRGIVGDGLGTILAATTTALGGNVATVKSWATDITKIISVLPEGFQKAVDKVLQTVNKWVEFGNGVLGVMKKLGFDVPATMGDLIQGMVKKLDFSSLLNKVKSFGSSFLSSLKNIFSSAAGMIAGGLGAFAASFGVGGTAGKLLGAGGGALAGAKIGSLIAPGLGTAIGAIGGAIFGGLFGGKKSKEQQAAEDAAKQRASLDMQKAAADIMSAQMEGLKKGLELLEGLKTFSEVPAKAIKRFFNEIEMILNLFAEMAKKFKADSIEASKTVAEVMTGAFESLISGANLIQAIKNAGSVTDQNITDFINTTFQIFEKWSKAADQIEISTAKFTGKIADKLRTSFEFLGIVPEIIKGFSESKPLDASILDSAFASIQAIVQRMKTLSEAERGLELNKAGASAGIFATIFDATKSILEAMGLFASYKPLGADAFSPINSDIASVTSWMNGLVSTTAGWSSLADAALANVSKWADGLGKISSSIKAALGGASSTNGITSSITYQTGALTYARSGSAETGVNQSTVINHNNFQIMLSLKDLEELADAPDKIRALEKKLNDGGSRTGPRAQSFAGY